MHDYFSELFEWDEHGNRRRKKRVLGDHEHLHVPMMMMDSAAGLRRTFSDGSIDHSHWSRPGFRVLDTSDAAKLAADAAYEERRTRLANAWRRDEGHQDSVPDDKPTLDELEAAAKKSWEERNARMRNAWKTR